MIAPTCASSVLFLVLPCFLLFAVFFFDKFPVFPYILPTLRFNYSLSQLLLLLLSARPLLVPSSFCLSSCLSLFSLVSFASLYSHQCLCLTSLSLSASPRLVFYLNCSVSLSSFATSPLHYSSPRVFFGCLFLPCFFSPTAHRIRHENDTTGRAVDDSIRACMPCSGLWCCATGRCHKHARCGSHCLEWDNVATTLGFAFVSSSARCLSLFRSVAESHSLTPFCMWLSLLCLRKYPRLAFTNVHQLSLSQKSRRRNEGASNELQRAPGSTFASLSLFSSLNLSFSLFPPLNLWLSRSLSRVVVCFFCRLQ